MNEVLKNGQPCKSQHKWNGQVPTNSTLHLRDKNCDCGKIKLVYEKCSCGSGFKMKFEENANYIPNN